MHRASPHRLTANLLYGATIALAVALPYEVIDPVLTLPWFEFTGLELAITATAIVWAVHVLVLAEDGRLRAFIAGFRRHRLLLLLALAFVLIAALSALLAPVNRLEAGKFTTRFVTGVYLLLLTACVGSSRARVTGLLWALVAGATTSALLGLGEVAGWAALDPILPLFKVGPTYVGGALRLSGTFPYATIASMYQEMAVPLALVLAALAGRRLARALALLMALICSVAVVLTLTRSGLVVLVAVSALAIAVGVWRFRALVLPAAVTTLAVVVSVALTLRDNTAFQARLTTENDTNWYNTTYHVPARLTLAAGDTTVITVSAQNTGAATWYTRGENPFRLGYYWLIEDEGETMRTPHVEQPLPYNVAPGETLQLDVPITPSLPAGEYRLVWGMLQSNILWFRHRDVPEAETLVEITPGAGPAAQPPAGLTPADEDLPDLPVTVPRGELWRAALNMWGERPLLGVGPDNFRHLYGNYIGLARWDTRIHSNNLYLELLATVGALGLAAFGAFVIAIIWRIACAVRAPSGDPVTRLLALGLGGVLLAFLMHGALDYFLGATPTFGLFWMAMGLTAAITARTDGATRAPYAPAYSAPRPAHAPADQAPGTAPGPEPGA
ncbi:MAG: hypothetical protein Kow00120_02970 [Anaerolineae bacterium]